jgi:alkanesulfonate monooxygenase SsuD/methylene tetrahydromethanopterin reductase-like flavin-dependent oxidoreductase (luciferase family)
MAELRFGVVSESVREGRAWLDRARQIEDTGIDVLLIRDHFSAGALGQQLAPFTALAAAAAVTSRLRVGTIVLSNDFRRPVIVAHEAASLHLVCGGRFGLGLGSGWYQPEYDRHRRGDGMGDADDLHRQPGPDPGRLIGGGAGGAAESCTLP